MIKYPARTTTHDIFPLHDFRSPGIIHRYNKFAQEKREKKQNRLFWKQESCFQLMTFRFWSPNNSNGRERRPFA